MKKGRSQYQWSTTLKKKVKSFEKNRQIKRIKKFLPTLSKLGIMKL